MGRLLCALGWHRWDLVTRTATFMEVVKPYVTEMVVERTHKVHVLLCTRCGRTR